MTRASLLCFGVASIALLGGRPAAAQLQEGQKYWAFQAPQKVSPPSVKDTAWPHSDIDRFLLARLESKGLHPVGDADKRTLIRRITFDLIGLPPLPQEVDDFVNDSSSSALEKVVDRLLDSPRFGERWGRHWLDVARYAETTGKTSNFNYPQAWRYRDYVIASFNADKPYDQFIKEQLAGDLLPTDDPKAKAERLIATGFLAIGPKALDERSGLQFELDVADEQIDVTTQAFLGLTAACARCHDHKFDPIPMQDYYALAGIFRSTQTCYGTVPYIFIASVRPTPLLPLPADCGLPAGKPDRLTTEERERIQKQIDDLQKRETTDQIVRLVNFEQLTLLRARLDAYDADGNAKLLAMGVRDKPSAGRSPFGRGRGPGMGMGMGMFGASGGSAAIADSPIHLRGEPNQRGEVVPRGFLQVLSRKPPVIKAGSGRRELADWIANRDNPLTARVMVNRVWMHLFGRGIVPTLDNFGVAGQPPTNPELLDHLAITFMDDGWSVKGLIRRMVLSRAYQLGSHLDAANAQADPENALVWRMPPRRLDAEALRDSMLSVSGLLDSTPPVGSAVARMGEGPSLSIFPGGAGGRMTQAVNDTRDNHRSVYLAIVRDYMPESMSLFDAADCGMVIAQRQSTTVPSQSLYMLNSSFSQRVAEAAAGRIYESGASDEERITAAYRLSYGREATAQEQGAAKDFLTRFSAAAARDRVPAFRLNKESWAALCQAMFASAEFQFRK